MSGAALPLAGRRVVVTRAERQSAELCAAFAAAGAQVETLPLLAVVPPADPLPLARAAGELPLFDWVVFTSTNAVHSLLAAVHDAPAPVGSAPPAGRQGAAGLRRAAAVGAATAAALRGAGIEPALVAPGGEQNAGGLLAALLQRFDCGQRVLLPQAADARPTLRDGLLAAGIGVVAVVGYEKRLPAEAPARAAQLFGAGNAGDVRDIGGIGGIGGIGDIGGIGGMGGFGDRGGMGDMGGFGNRRDICDMGDMGDMGDIGWVTFTSPSTVRNFAGLFGADWPRRRHQLLAASIGPVTSAELRRCAIEPAAEAARPGAEPLVEAVIAAVSTGRRPAG